MISKSREKKGPLSESLATADTVGDWPEIRPDIRLDAIARVRVYARRRHGAQIKPDDHRVGQQRYAGSLNPTLIVMNACSHFVSVHVLTLTRRRTGNLSLFQFPCALITAH